MQWYEYDENNSGGGRWLSHDDHIALIRAGWIVFDGSFTCSAYKQFNSEAEAIAEWESITGQDVNEIGCECCGPPHSIYESSQESLDYDLNTSRYKSRKYDIIDTTGSVVDRKAIAG